MLGPADIEAWLEEVVENDPRRAEPRGPASSGKTSFWSPANWFFAGLFPASFARLGVWPWGMLWPWSGRLFGRRR